MKGTELTPWQLEAAGKFIQERRIGASDICIADDQEIRIKHGDLVRLVAWYGAVRAEATLKGIPPDRPGSTTPRGQRQGAEDAQNNS